VLFSNTSPKWVVEVRENLTKKAKKKRKRVARKDGIGILCAPPQNAERVRRWLSCWSDESLIGFLIPAKRKKFFESNGLSHSHDVEEVRLKLVSGMKVQVLMEGRATRQEWLESEDYFVRCALRGKSRLVRRIDCISAHKPYKTLCQQWHGGLKVLRFLLIEFHLILIRWGV
jgi:hypothetical protein